MADFPIITALCVRVVVASKTIRSSCQCVIRCVLYARKLLLLTLEAGLALYGALIGRRRGLEYVGIRFVVGSTNIYLIPNRVVIYS